MVGYPEASVRFASFFTVVGLASLLWAAACSSDETKLTSPASDPDAGRLAEGGERAARFEPVAKPTGAPITDGKLGEWTWTDFPDTKCADGSPTGLGMNLGTSKRLLIFLDGGGACWDELTCLDYPTFMNSRFDRSVFESYITEYIANSPIDRVNADNPFKDDDIAFVPYCTADIHAGANAATYRDKTFHHWGRRNLAAFLNRLVPTFADAERVILIGASAGGLGTLANYFRVRESFALYGAPKRVDAIDDSGPPLPTADNIFINDQNAAWDFASAAPEGCDDCANEGAAVLPFYAKRYPDARIAFISHDEDRVMAGFFLMPQATFKNRIQGAVTNYFTANPNAQAFILPGDDHPALQHVLTAETGSPPVALKKWIVDMLADSPAWKTVTP